MKKETEKRYESDKLIVYTVGDLDMTDDNDVALELFELSLTIFKHFPEHFEKREDKVNFIKTLSAMLKKVVDDWNDELMGSIDKVV